MRNNIYRLMIYIENTKNYINIYINFFLKCVKKNPIKIKRGKEEQPHYHPKEKNNSNNNNNSEQQKLHHPSDRRTKAKSFGLDQIKWLESIEYSPLQALPFYLKYYIFSFIIFV